MQSSALVVVALGAFLELPAVAQAVGPQQVDRIFAAYDKAGSPGCSLGVIREGEFVYRKSYGLASLELGVPLSTQSVFYVGSISKQFTAASVVLASEQGFLSLDDDVRKYLPELPDYGHTITLRQMLHQTSGFRDFFSLLYFSGLDAAEFHNPDDILKLVARQKGLNNTPGDEWIYSNTNYFLLGVVVERATRQRLSEFAARNIFEPLGMTHTRFYDNAKVVAPGRVAAYEQGPHGDFLVDWSTSYAVVGGGGLMSTVDDLLLWDRNFYANRLGKGTLVKELETRGALNDGRRISYAMGLTMGNYRGLPTVEHGGALFGYRAELLRFPDQRFTVICLCNLSSADPAGRSHKVADLYLNKDFEPEAKAIPPLRGGPLPDPVAFAGNYLDPRTHRVYSFTASDGSLKGWGAALRRISANQFYDLAGNVITFEARDGRMKATLDRRGEIYFSGARAPEIRPSEGALAALAGEYRSAELEGKLSLSLEQGKLMVRNGGNPPLELISVGNDEFDAGGVFSVVFRRDGAGKVSGLRVFAPSARGIEFRKAL